ncbi:MAG TPA: lysophospholipase [Bacteroidales bacterium]|nr:lysophospholipase [Bacteroidales bacterium]
MEFEIKLESQPVIKAWVLKPATEATGVIIFIHGLGDHFGRYSRWTSRFLEKGIAVIAADLPGHGLSEGKRGHIAGLDVVNQLLENLLSVSGKEFPSQSAILYGHSLGGLLVLNWLYSNSGSIERAIITSPWLKLSFDPPKLKILLAKIVKSILPGLIQPTGLIPEYFSHDPEVAIGYRNDKLTHEKVSVRLFFDCYMAARKILDNPGVIKSCILLIHGGDDKITSPDGSREFHKTSGNTTLKIWEGGYHELHNELFKDELFEFIINWVENKKV